MPAIGTAVLGPMLSTTNDGGVGILLSKEMSFSLQANQRINIHEDYTLTTHRYLLDLPFKYQLAFLHR
jgi:hypothetical protein